MIPYTRAYYLDTIEKGVKKLLNSTSVPVAQLEEMVYMIGELKKTLHISNGLIKKHLKKWHISITKQTNLVLN